MELGVGGLSGLSNPSNVPALARAKGHNLEPTQVAAMAANLSAIELALRALTESELDALIVATKRVPTTLAPGLIAWFLAAL
jgi:hypothetical protein